VALNVATGGTAKWFPTVDQHYLRWLAGSTGAVAACGLLAWWAQRWYERGLVALVPVARPGRHSFEGSKMSLPCPSMDVGCSSACSNDDGRRRTITCT
jgi:hypothetical protein